MTLAVPFALLGVLAASMQPPVTWPTVGLVVVAFTANRLLAARTRLLEGANAELTLATKTSAVGAVPVIKVLRESLVAAEVNTVFGIVNGTTNYMLSAMTAVRTNSLAVTTTGRWSIK